jgi:hypothetical protein
MGYYDISKANWVNPTGHKIFKEIKKKIRTEFWKKTWTNLKLEVLDQLDEIENYSKNELKLEDLQMIEEYREKMVLQLF